VLRFDFEGGSDRGGSELKRVSWDDWWQVFEGP
jgi:hypothetical protein